MNWPRVKTILIFLFLAVDLILLATIIVPSVGLSRIPQETVETTASLLASRGIEISSEIIPARRESLGVIELYNLWPDPTKLSEQLIGTSQKTEDNKYKNGNRQLTLSESGFVYLNLRGETSVSHELVTLGIDPREHLYEQGENSIRIWQSVEKKKIFESEIYGAKNGEEITLSGYWIFSDREKSIITNTPDTLVDVTGVLIDFISNPLRDENIKITSVELGYSTGTAYRDMSHKLVSASPAYKISTDTGTYYMYDALSGDFLYALKNGEIKTQ